MGEVNSVSINDLRMYNGQRVTKLHIGEVVTYKDSFYIVESTGLVEPLRLTPIRSDNSRKELTLEK